MLPLSFLREIRLFYENEQHTERMWLVFLKHNMHLYQGSFSCFKCCDSYFFFELEPEWEDPEDWLPHLKSHKHHGKKNEVSRLSYKHSAVHTWNEYTGTTYKNNITRQKILITIT